MIGENFYEVLEGERAGLENELPSIFKALPRQHQQLVSRSVGDHQAHLKQSIGNRSHSSSDVPPQDRASPANATSPALSLLPTKTIRSLVIRFPPGELDRANDCGRQIAHDRDFPSLATTKTVAVADLLPLVSLSLPKQPPLLVMICSTAVSASSTWSAP